MRIVFPMNSDLGMALECRNKLSFRQSVKMQENFVFVFFLSDIVFILFVLE